jgi:hypothetical protein
MYAVIRLNTEVKVLTSGIASVAVTNAKKVIVTPQKKSSAVTVWL